MSKSQNQPSTSTKPINRPIHPIIEIVNGYKHFGLSRKWHQAMRNVNLMAYAGEVYVLLGPHGSGKTTILNIILGVYSLNQGLVKIFGLTPGDRKSNFPAGRVGYGPQSSGLFQQMTINETLKYYGKILKLKSSYINERMSYLSDLLALPAGSSCISHCNEIEKRQISFAVAILHEPELLLLDEPCQGIDPVFRTNIWEHLHFLVKKGVTIFITTQNIPEAHKADRLGILRSGYLLMEGNPSELASEYKEQSIESLYTSIYSLKIRKDMPGEKKSVHDHPRVRLEIISATGSEGFLYVPEEEDKQRKETAKLAKRDNICLYLRKYLKILPNCRRLGMLLYRDLLLTFRSYTWLILAFLIPILLVIVFSYTVGQQPTNLSLGIVNFEATKSDCQKQYEKYISCQVLQQIDKNVIRMVYYEKYKEAENDAFELKISGVLIVGEKFTNQLMRTMANIAVNNVKYGNPETAQLVLRLDMTSRIVANGIEHAVKMGVEEYLRMATKDTKIQNATIGYPMKVGKPIFGEQNAAETEFICNGLTIVLLYHLASFLTSITVVSYRTLNLATRDYIAGVRLIESILSQMVIYGLLLFIEAILMYMVLMLIRNMPIKGSLPYLALVVIVQIWCGLCFGFFIASLTKTSVQAGCIVFCCLCASLILCGVLWPLNGQPDWLLTVVKLLPQTQAICAVRCIVQRGISINNEEVYLGVIITLVWLILFILLTYLITK